MDIKKLQDLYEGLKETPHIEVGVFSGKSARSDGPLTNAALASIHEFGAPKAGIPPRSMLRVPIADHAKEIMAPARGKAEAFLKRGTLLQLYKTIGVAAEKIVLQAFQTGGFGKWPSLKYSTLLQKLRGPHGARQVERKGKLVWINKKGRSLAKRKSLIGQIYAGQIGEGILIRTGQLRRSFSSRVRMAFK